MNKIVMALVMMFTANIASANKIVSGLVYQDSASKVWVRDSLIEQQIYVSTEDGQRVVHEFSRYDDIKSVTFVAFSTKHQSGIIEISFNDADKPSHMIAFDPNNKRSAELMMYELLSKIRN